MLLGRQAAEGVEHRRAITQLLAIERDELADARFFGKGLRQTLDGGCRHIGNYLRRFRRHVFQVVNQHLEGGARRFAIDAVGALERRLDACDKGLGAATDTVPYQGCLAILVEQDDARSVHQLRRVGVIHQERFIDGSFIDHDLGHGQHHGHVLAGAHRHPLVSLGRVMRQARLDDHDLETFFNALCPLPVEPARSLFTFEITGAEIEQQFGMFQIGQDVGASPGQLVGHVTRSLAGRGAVNHVGGAERLGEANCVVLTNQVLALAVLPDQFAWIFCLDLVQLGCDDVEGLVPADLNPARILVAALLGVGAFERLLQTVRVIGVVHARGALGADAMVVKLRARSVWINGAHHATDHGGIDTAKIRADRAA